MLTNPGKFATNWDYVSYIGMANYSYNY